ncbi:MAG: purple acid phosphatase family protein [Streptosporangiaceae bacterium]
MTISRMTPEQARRLSLAEQHDWYRRVRLRARPGRPEVPDGTAVPAVGRHVAFGLDPARQMRVAWQVPALVRDPFLRVGESPGDLSQKIAAEVRTVTTRRGDTHPVHPAPPAAGPVIEQYYLHAAADGLLPGRRYYYRVGHRGRDPGAGIPDGTFATAPAGRVPFTFTAFGDQGVSYDAAGTAALVAAQDPAFHLHAGDISYAESGGHGLITDGYDPRIWDSYFTQIEQAASRVPWQVAVGNHEMEAWHSADGYGGLRARFAFPGPPQAAGTPPAWYCFTYGNVAVVSLDANDVSAEITANSGYAGGAQTSWLAATLAALRGRADIDFIVAFFHHCAYCTCSAHGSDGGVRAEWVPLLDRYQVDLVINGHNHIYERTDPLTAGSPGPAAPPGATVRPAADGTTYITAGGGGKDLYGFPAADSYAGRAGPREVIGSYVHQPGGAAGEQVAWSRVRYTGYCLLVADSRPGPLPGGRADLMIRALAQDGTEIDRVILAR